MIGSDGAIIDGGIRNNYAGVFQQRENMIMFSYRTLLLYCVVLYRRVRYTVAAEYGGCSMRMEGMHG